METPKIKLRYSDRDTLFKKEYSELKIKVALNWFEIIALITVSIIGLFKIIQISEIKSIPVIIVLSLLGSTLITLLFCSFRKYQLKISRFDKEHIYKKISNDLIDKSKEE